MGFIDSLIDAGASAITAIPQAIFGHYENNRNMHFQSDEAKAQRDWQSSENQKNRQWQEDMYNLYNSPSAMMRQYKEGNLNPFLMASQNNIGNGMSATPSSGSGASAAGSSPPALSPHSGLYLQSLGVNADVANQHAKTIQQKWETYQYIREHVGRDAAKRWLANNPDMMETDSPENDPWMKTYKRSETRENLENSMLETKDWLLSRYGDQEHQKALQEADARISDIASKMNERDSNIALMTEKMATEVAHQYQLYASGNESNAKAATENQLRKYLINKFVIDTGLAAYTFMREKYSFDSEEELRNWLVSDEGKEAIRDMERNGLITNAPTWLRYTYQFLDHLPFAAGANANFSRSKVVKP